MHLHIKHGFLLLIILVMTGCAEGFSVAPQWDCIQAKEKINLFEKLDRSVSPPELLKPSGAINTDENVRIRDRHKGSSGRTTHFLVQTQKGVNGWFPWEGNTFSGWHSQSCW